MAMSPVLKGVVVLYELDEQFLNLSEDLSRLRIRCIREHPEEFIP